VSGILFDRARSSPDPRWGTIGEPVREAAQRSGDREFLRFPGVSLTFAEVHEASSRLAQVLVAHGIQPGDRVAIMLGNVPEWPLSWFAIGQAGAIAVPVNARYRESDLAFVLADSGAVLVLTSDEHAGLVRAVAATVGPVREVLTAAELARELADAPLGDPAVALEPSAIANFQYTSGTTGFPKACMLSHGYWLRTGWLTAIEAELRADDVMLMAQAFSYLDPQWAALMCLMGGCPLVVLPQFSASRFSRSVREHGATLTYVLGAMPGLMFGQQPDTRTAVSLLDHARTRLARFKVPAYLEFMESFPMTPSARVEKRKLTEPGQDQRTGVFDAAANTWV
jgi:acyl-CoA synthetase (AMP-forming)/AMP-acid ligase II